MIASMMPDDEFDELALEIIDDLRPSFDAVWTNIIDGEIGGGELLVAVDDALQAAALLRYGIDADLAERVDRVITDLNDNDPVRERLVRWMKQIPRRSAA